MSSSSVEKIKERLSIVDVISWYLTLSKAGKNYKAKCPFHNEKTPSFFVSPERGSYYCFGCGAKGDIFSFVEQFEGTDFLGALKLLADKAGVILENDFSKDNKKEKEKLYEIMEEATNFFVTIFNKETAPRAYLLDRGVSSSMIKEFKIGFAPKKWQSVSNYLLKKGYKKENLEKVGLIKLKVDGSFYDRFRSRIIFPISDSSGRVIAFTGRIFSLENKESSVEQAKYLNSPDTPIFNKSNTLFGIDKAKTSIRKRDYTIIVEGQFDLILSHQAGFTNTVAVSGTALSERINEYQKLREDGNSNEVKINNLGLIRRLSSNVIFAFDGDQAGIKAASRSALIALSLEMQVKIAILPEGQDPADIISKNVNVWKAIIKNSVDIVTFHLNKICQTTNDLRLRGKKVKEIIFPFISKIKSSIEKSSYITLIHQKTGLSENALNEDFQNYESEVKNLDNYNPTQNIKDDTISHRDKLEERLFGIVFWQTEDNDKKEVSDIQVKVQEIYNDFKERIGEDQAEKLEEKNKVNVSILAFEAEIWYGSNVNKIIPDLEELTLNLEEEILKDKLTYLKDEISQKEKESSKEGLEIILRNYQKIVERIEKIKEKRAK